MFSIRFHIKLQPKRLCGFHLLAQAQRLSSYHRHSAKLVTCSNLESSRASVGVLGLQRKMKFIDIGANLLDRMYQGEYNGKIAHPPDLDAVLQRSWQAGVERIIITAGNLEESKAALEVAKSDERLFCTVGVHPTRCGEFESHPEGPEAYLNELRSVLQEGMAARKAVAVGECGLDYDRLHFCDKDVQKTFFEQQFALAEESGLPMFLHLRAAAQDFLTILKPLSHNIRGGVVHSFDGSLDELHSLMEISNIAIGINGCSLKSDENLGVMAAIPDGRLLIETDAPWCEIRSTHAGKKYITTVHAAKDKKKHDVQCMVKGRNEPANIRQVFEVVAGHRKEQDMEAFSHRIWQNTVDLFFTDSCPNVTRGSELTSM